MATRGFIAHRLRGRYYVTYNLSDSSPTGLGKDLISEIPVDPVQFQEWKLAKIDFFRAEETRILLLAREGPHRSSRDESYWGYVQMPSRGCSLRGLAVEWIYVTDLDQNVFHVSRCNYPPSPDSKWRNTRYFRLDNIPRWLFDQGPSESPTSGSPYPVMSASVPAKYSADYLREIPEPDPELLELYQSLSPTPTPSFSLPQTPGTSPWHRLQLQLLNHFVEHFLFSFHRLCPSRKGSRFTLRQLAYAMLSLTSSDGMKFHRTRSRHKVHAGSVRTRIRTPSWEPPDADSYWLGDVLILLHEHLDTPPDGSPSALTRATIARAVQLATATPRDDVVVVLFAVHAVLLVRILATPTGPSVTYTPTLPLLVSGPGSNTFGRPTLTTSLGPGCATLGALALQSLFTERPRVSRFPAITAPPILPTELWQLVFRAADVEAQDGMESTCRLFRALAGECPRIGGWFLVRCHGVDQFVAFNSSGAERVVCVDVVGRANRGGGGCEVGLWGVGRLRLNMPLVKVSVVGEV